MASYTEALLFRTKHTLLSLLFTLNNLRHRFLVKWMARKNMHYFLHAGVHFDDKASVVMHGKCMISIDNSAHVRIGRAFILNSGGGYCIDNQPFAKLNIGPNAILTIGEESGLSNSVIQCLERIEIGNHVNIGAGCLIMDSDFHSVNWADRADRKTDIAKAKRAPIIVGDYVLVGARSIICKGVTIGPRTTIAAGSVVAKDIPADCLAGGNPCKVIRYNGASSLDDGIVE